MKSNNNSTKSLCKAFKHLNQEEFRFYVASILKDIVAQSRFEEVLKFIVFCIVILRKKSISRAYIEKSLGISLSCISDHNVKISDLGILDIERKRHFVNRYSGKFIMALASLFGFVDPIKWRSASLTNYIYSKSSTLAKIYLLIEFGSACFMSKNNLEVENSSQTSTKAQMWDILLDLPF